MSATSAADVTSSGTGIEAPPKPSLRGVSHLVAFFVALVAGPVLVAQATTTTARVTTTIYAVSLVALFGCSALLHRGNWSDRTRQSLRRLDHSTIFLFIAGTYTPVCALSLGTGLAQLVLTAVWVGALAGIGVTLFWLDAPRWITAGCYIAVGWVALLAIAALWSSLGPGRFALLAGGGILYTVGAVVYARKRPDPIPHVFGYHEVFHALVIAAVICHYALITSLVRS